MILVLQIYLFLGLVLHKVVWEALKRNDGEKPKENNSAGLVIIKAVKVFILVSILVQYAAGYIAHCRRFNKHKGYRAIIYTLGLATALAAGFQLGENWANIETGQVLTRQAVVANGIYRYVRHPIYIGDLLLLFGLELGRIGGL